jgi:molybdate transport system regulatory protein
MTAKRSPLLSVQARIRINYGASFAFGPGKAELLEHIDATGSISEAAKAMEMSYMRAWKIVGSLETAFAEPLVLKSRGGSARGGAVLSETGRAVLRIYREIERAGNESTRAAADELARLLAG